MYSLACSGLNSRRKKGEYEGQQSAARSHIVYIGAITHMRRQAIILMIDKEGRVPSYFCS